MSHRCQPRVGSDGFCFAGGCSGTGRKDKPARCQKGVPPGTGTSELPLSFSMQARRRRTDYMGKGILLWLLGVPIPVIIILWFLFH